MLARQPPVDLAGPPPGRLLPGPVGEENRYWTAPRGTVLCRAASAEARDRQIDAALATGNRTVVAAGAGSFEAALFEGDRDDLLAFCQELAARPGPIVPVYVARPDGSYPAEWLVRECASSTNTTAAGGNANLMAIG